MSGSTGGFSWPSRRPASIAGRSALRDCLGRRMSSSTDGSGGVGEWLSALPALPPGDRAESAAWNGPSSTVSRALALIEMARWTKATSRAAQRLGVGARQLHRLFRQHLGASPLAVAQTRRILPASSLFTRPRCACRKSPWRRALAAFGGLTRHSAKWLRPPGTLRRGSGVSVSPGAAVTVLLRYRPPYDWPAMIAFLRARAILLGVEILFPTNWRPHHRYRRCPRCRPLRRSPRAGKCLGSECARREAVRAAVDHRPAPARIRPRGGPGDHRSTPIASPPSPRVAQRRGLRVPGAWDGFELAVRAMLGQQITVAGAINLAGRLVSRYGERSSTTGPAAGRLTSSRAPRSLRRPTCQPPECPRFGPTHFRRSLRPLRSIPRSSALDARLRRPSFSSESWLASESGRRRTSRCGSSESRTRFRPQISACFGPLPARTGGVPRRRTVGARRTLASVAGLRRPAPLGLPRAGKKEPGRSAPGSPPTGPTPPGSPLALPQLPSPSPRTRGDHIQRDPADNQPHDWSSRYVFFGHCRSQPRLRLGEPASLCVRDCGTVSWPVRSS